MSRAPRTHRVALDRAAVLRQAGIGAAPRRSPPRPVARRARGPFGRLGEDLAVGHLTGDGLVIIARNWRVRTGHLAGELDVVAHDPDDGTLVVCAVETRRDGARSGGAVVGVDRRTRAHVRSLTGVFLRESSSRAARVRFDVIAIDLGHDAALTHLERAW
jgi:putative endonuclease